MEEFNKALLKERMVPLMALTQAATAAPGSFRKSTESKASRVLYEEREANSRNWAYRI